MRLRRGPWLVALFASAVAATGAFAQLPDPVPPSPPAQLPPPAAPEQLPAATDPLTDLMRRVNNLEGELQKEKQKQLAKAADAAKKPTLNWGVQIQADGVWAGQDAALREAVGVIPDGAAFRRARFNAAGEYGPWIYKFGMDFALSGHPSFIDVFLGLTDVPYLGTVRVGHFFEPFGLEHYSQNRFLTMLERSLPSDVLGPPRNLGVMANDSFANERATWALGLFRTDSDVFGGDSGNDFQSAVTGRVTGLAWYDDSTQGRDLLHVGGSYSARGTRDDRVRFRSRPEIRIGSVEPNIPYLADTGDIPAHFYQLLNAELLWVRGPFSVQAEYQLMPVSTADRGAVYFQAWYAMASVFLTGEHRAYRKATGVLERIIPRRDFVKKDACGLTWGPGAWELAFRVSHLDLDDRGIAGGRLTDLTFGVNWYMNPYVRMTANYVRAFQSPARGADGTADIFGIRMGYEF